jgi:hypothetical protein
MRENPEAHEVPAARHAPAKSRFSIKSILVSLLALLAVATLAIVVDRFD